MIDAYSLSGDIWEAVAAETLKRYDGLLDRVSLYTTPPRHIARQVTATFLKVTEYSSTEHSPRSSRESLLPRPQRGCLRSRWPRQASDSDLQGIGQSGGVAEHELVGAHVDEGTADVQHPVPRTAALEASEDGRHPADHAQAIVSPGGALEGVDWDEDAVGDTRRRACL